MIISRKRFEAELEKARREGMEQVWQDQRNERMFAELNERVDRIATVIHNLDQRTNVNGQCKGGCNKC